MNVGKVLNSRILNINYRTCEVQDGTINCTSFIKMGEMEIKSSCAVDIILILKCGLQRCVCASLYEVH
jgi:hypothetical protein